MGSNKIKSKAIYKITNLINNKLYIGQSVHPDKRWWEHCNHALKHLDNYPLHLAINKYGIENFSFEILEWTENYDNRERELIKFYNSLAPNGYNVIEGGPSPVYFGEDNFKNTTSNETIDNIINELFENKLTDVDIGEKYGVSEKVVRDVNHGTTHVRKGIKYPIREFNDRPHRLSLENAKNIKYLLATTDWTYFYIAELYNTTKEIVYQINRGIDFHDDTINYPIRDKDISKLNSQKTQFKREINVKNY